MFGRRRPAPSSVDAYYADVAHPPGLGVGGHGAGLIMPLPFPDRAAPTRYDDRPGGRFSTRPAAGAQGVGLQLKNGVSQLAGLHRLGNPVGMFARRPVNTPRHMLPGDRAMIAPSPSQIQQWAAAGAGSIPDSIGGNGSVLAGYPMGGGAY